MDDGLLVCVLHAFADLDEEFHPLADSESVFIAVGRYGNTGHKLHHEVGPAIRSRAGIEHFGDGGVIHKSQGLALGLKAGRNLPGVHSSLDELDSDTTAHRTLLFSEPDLAHPALADQLQKVVGTEEASTYSRGPV